MKDEDDEESSTTRGLCCRACCICCKCCDRTPTFNPYDYRKMAWDFFVGKRRYFEIMIVILFLKIFFDTSVFNLFFFFILLF